MIDPKKAEKRLVEDQAHLFQVEMDAEVRRLAILFNRYTNDKLRELSKDLRHNRSRVGSGIVEEMIGHTDRRWGNGLR